MKKILLIISLLSLRAFAIPETELQDSWKSKALNYFLSMNSGRFQNTEGQRLSYSFALNPGNKKKLIIVPGRTEPAMKYAEVLYDLKDQDFDLFIMDHQGQGESSRIPNDLQKGHVNRFDDYVTDLEAFIRTIVIPEGDKESPLYLLAHSMGGAISVKLMAKSPQLIKKAALIAPMIEMNTAPYSETVARIFSKFLVLTGKSFQYAPGRGPYVPEEDIFENNPYTHSEERFNVAKYISVNYPRLIVAGPTTRWVHESLKATKKLSLVRLKTPLILFQAGLDEIVKPRRQKNFCLNNDCQFHLIPDAHHEILMERDVIRDDVIMKIKDFFAGPREIVEHGQF